MILKISNVVVQNCIAVHLTSLEIQVDQSVKICPSLLPTKKLQKKGSSKQVDLLVLRIRSVVDLKLKCCASFKKVKILSYVDVKVLLTFGRLLKCIVTNNKLKAGQVLM